MPVEKVTYRPPRLVNELAKRQLVHQTPPASAAWSQPRLKTGTGWVKRKARKLDELVLQHLEGDYEPAKLPVNLVFIKRLRLRRIRLFRRRGLAWQKSDGA